MYEIDLFQVGSGERPGDAIAGRYFNPAVGRMNYFIIDAGWQETGEKVVSQYKRYYGTDHVDVAFLTHPDGDHIGGMGTVVRELNVQLLVLHDIAAHGGSTLDAVSEVSDLIRVGRENGTEVIEAWAGASLLEGSLVMAGPSETYYEQLVAEQVEAERTGKRAAATGKSVSALAEALRRAGGRFLDALPVEVPFGDAGGTNPRNNTSIILDLRLEDDNRVLFTGDAGAPALNNALDVLDVFGRSDKVPDLLDVPHHGSRHNLDTDTLTRLFGGPGQPENIRSAIVSCTADSKYPSPRVANALMRRGCGVVTTETGNMRYGSPDAPARDGYRPVDPLPPMDESLEDDD